MLSKKNIGDLQIMKGRIAGKKELAEVPFIFLGKMNIYFDYSFI